MKEEDYIRPQKPKFTTGKKCVYDKHSDCIDCQCCEKYEK